MSEVGQLISTTAREMPEGYFQPVKELGAKFALGAVGSAASPDVTSDPSVIKLAESVEPEARASQESLRHIEEPSIRLTGTLLDTLISKGMDKVNEQIRAEERKKVSTPS
jgi:pyocin large subunit-like protein